MVTIGSREEELQGGSIWGNFRKCDYAKTRRPIKSILQGFAANDITNIVLKFGDNGLNERGLRRGLNLWKI